MGTHPSCPSKLKYHTKAGKSLLLSEYLQDKPEQVGNVPSGYTNNNLPFLFKVLSIRTALSIQVSFVFERPFK